jgi:hypothetical protein
MPNCYWRLCTCPDTQPCPEHTGLACGKWNGLHVTALTQVSDAITRDAELAIQRLNSDSTEADAIRQRLEQRKRDLERIKADLDTAINTANSFSERRQAARMLQDAYRRIGETQQEIGQVQTDLDSINARASNAGWRVTLALIVPYTSASGYCACYTTKQNWLAAIASQRATLTPQVTALSVQRTAVANRVIVMWGRLPMLSDIMKGLGTLTTIAAIAAYMIFGWKIALIAVVIGLLLIAILVVTTCIQLAQVSAQLLAVRQQIVKADLRYYRQQSISTCRTPPKVIGDGPRSDPDDDENAWFVDNERGD